MAETNSLKLYITAVHCWKTDQALSDLQTPFPLPEFSPLSNGLYLIATTSNETLLRNGNCPIKDFINKRRELYNLLSRFADL